jgi:hypothetical protein
MYIISRGSEFSHEKLASSTLSSDICLQDNTFHFNYIIYTIYKNIVTITTNIENNK